MSFLNLNKIKSMICIEDPYADNYEDEKKEESTDEVKSVESPTPAVENSVVEVKVVKPETFASITEIADYLLNRCTVVLNLEATYIDDAKRMIDFLAGVAYSINGQLKCIANDTYIITPSDVDVADTQIKNEEQQQNPTYQATNNGLTGDTLF